MRRRLNQFKDRFLSIPSQVSIDFSVPRGHMHFPSQLLPLLEFGVPSQHVLRPPGLLIFYVAIIRVFYVEPRALHLSIL